ncbi:unnamed protein product [Gordionus sp. m RMFG-2023]
MVLDRTYHMDNCGNSRANTCLKVESRGSTAFIRSNDADRRSVTVFFNDPTGSLRETKVFGFRGKYGCKAET